MNTTTLKQLILSQDWIYENAGTRWQDGLILGNGNLGIIGYAPYGLEWVLNKVDVFDGRMNRGELVPHQQVMERFRKERLSNFEFLNHDEAPPSNSVAPLSKTAALVRLRFGNETDWAASRPHQARQRLCLWEGELYCELDMHLSHPRLRCLVPRDRNLFCIRLENVGAVLWNHTLELARPHDDDLKPPRWQGGDSMIAMEQVMPHGNARYAVVVLVVPGRGPKPDDPFHRNVSRRYWARASSVGRACCGSLHAQMLQAGNADIFVSVHTSYEDRNPMAAAIKEVRVAARQGFDALERANRRWWQRFWSKGWADFGAHRQIQKYWTFSLYETACLLGKAPVPGLYGLWHGPTDGPRCGIGASWYTHDQNVQIPMMPIFPLNRAELVVPFADTYLHLARKLRRNTRRLFGRKGICIPLCMNQIGDEVTGGMYRYSLHGGPYSGVILVWAWRYTRDLKLLKEKLYPLLREFVRFYVEAMKLGPDGRYHLDWEIPPEIFTVSRDVTATLALLKPCLETAIEAAGILGQDSKERRRWEHVRDRFPEYPKRRGGDWWAGADVPHDHYTQAAYLLYPFFPGESHDGDGEKTAALTLDRMTQHDIEMSYADTHARWHYKRSWAWFFPTITRLRLGRRQEAWAALHDGLRLFSKPNGLFSHNPVIEAEPGETEANLRHIPKGTLRQADGTRSSISEFRCHDAGPAATSNPNARRWVTPASEGSGAFLLAATEALLQSHGGLVRLFPGVPEDFTGGFERLLASGAVEVSACMKRGCVVRCKMRAWQATVVRLLNPWKTVPRLHRGAAVETQEDGRSIISILLARNQVWDAQHPQIRTQRDGNFDFWVST
ncbi:MAG: hypothetical protein HY360_23455 [Verrucomicrobia bacterium]|nr:hypothetical protein [Verrucomicrobiota bacterium]